VIKAANRPSSLNRLRFYPLERPLQCITICGALQLPLDHWSEVIADPVIADAIRDRLQHAALTINITGESYRGVKARKLASKKKDA
jgi:IstB-like ATP binding protein